MLTFNTDLISKLAVRIAPEQSDTDLRNQLLRNQFQTRLQRVVDLDLAFQSVQFDAAARVGGEVVLGIDFQVDVSAGLLFVQFGYFGDDAFD